MYTYLCTIDKLYYVIPSYIRCLYVVYFIGVSKLFPAILIKNYCLINYLLY